MWNGIGYLIPQKGDKSGGGAPPSTFYIIAQTGTTTEMQTEDGTKLMIREIAP